MHLFFLSIAALLFVFALTWSVGYGICSIWFSQHPEEGVVAAPGIGILLIGYLSFLSYLSSPQWNLLLVLPLGLSFTQLLKAHRESRRTSSPLPFPLAQVGYALFLLSFQYVLSTYSGNGWYGDWAEHFFRSQFFFHHYPIETRFFGLYSIAYRTPLLHWYTSYFFSFFGSHFWIFQLTVTYANALFIGPYLLILKRVSPRCQNFGLFFVFFSSFLWRSALYTWPKTLVAYYILLGYSLYIRIRAPLVKGNSPAPFFLLLLGIILGSAYLAHPYGTYYVLFFVLDILLLSAFHHKSFLGSFPLLVAVAAIGLPWLCWLFTTFGIEKSFEAMAPLNGAPHLISFLVAKTGNLVFTLIPSSLVVLPISIKGLFQNWPGGLKDILNCIWEIPFLTLTGAITLTLLIHFASQQGWKIPRNEKWTLKSLYFVLKHHRGHVQEALLSPYFFPSVFTLLGILMSVIILDYTQRTGVLHIGAMPSFLILLIYWLLPYTDRHFCGESRRLSRWIYGEFLFFALGYFYTVHSSFYQTQIFPNDPNKMLIREEFRLIFLSDLLKMPPLLIWIVPLASIFLAYYILSRKIG